MASSSLQAPQPLFGGKHSLTHLLQRTEALSVLLKLEDVRHWVSAELKGFAEDDEPPSYRKVSTHQLEVYNAHREGWQSAGILNYTYPARQPLAEIEAFSREKFVPLPVVRNFSIKNDFGDSFASDWPQRFMVRGSEYGNILTSVFGRWTRELEVRGFQVLDLEKFTGFLDAIHIFPDRK